MMFSKIYILKEKNENNHCFAASEIENFIWMLNTDWVARIQIHDSNPDRINNGIGSNLSVSIQSIGLI